MFLNWLLVTLCVVSLSGREARGGTEDLKQAFRHVRVLVVPGFMPRQEILSAFGVRESYEGVVRVLREMGLDAELSTVSPGGSVADGARILAYEISSSRMPVLAIGHSLGGNKILHAIVESTTTAAKTAGVIFVQSPLSGAIACDLGRRLLEPEVPFLRAQRTAIDAGQATHEACLGFFDPLGIGRAMLDPFNLRKIPYEMARATNQFAEHTAKTRSQILLQSVHGGDAAIFEEASPQRAKAYLEQHRARLVQLAERFPLLSVVGSGRSATFCALQLTLQSLGHHSDGIVETSSQNLGHGTVVASAEFDHLDLVLRSAVYRRQWEGFVRKVVESPRFTH